MKRRIYSLLALTLSLALTACSSDASAEHTASASETEEAAAEASSAQETAQEENTKTVTGMIASVDGTEVTLHLGEANLQFSSDPMPQKEDGQETPPDMPEGNSDSQTPPDKPDENGDGQTPPDMPEGETVTYDLSAAAQFGVLLPELYWFGRVPLLGIAVNVLLVAGMNVLLLLDWVTLLLAPIPWLAALPGAASRAVSEGYIRRTTMSSPNS